MLTKLHLTQNNQIPFPGEFNFLFSVKVEIYGQNPVFSFCQKNIRTKKKKNLTDIWETKNPKANQYTCPSAKTCVRFSSRAPWLFSHFQ